ncbi:MAG: 16S rRNA (guanine(527)-N(7))-methyltransferase RsmG [Proteobacteria bacterium]|nr:MAG: 16S rRNA (guanine(527)-N(7))-methyltransferase RsmG [Pseudomonadota bacterium]
MTKAAALAASPADKAQALRLAPVSHETEARLDRFVALLLEWQAKTNLIAPSTIPALWSRHVADSLQLLHLAPEATVWADFGSGGGFPGLVLACALADREGAEVNLVERNGKKAAFLREAARVTGAPAVVHPMDIGDYVDSVRERIDCVTARAVAPLQQLFTLSAPLIAAGTGGLFLKGQDVESELTEATKYWNIQYKLHRSLSDGGGFVVDVAGLAPRAALPKGRA